MSRYHPRPAVALFAAALVSAVSAAPSFAQEGYLAGPSVFNRTQPNSIGSARQTYDRELYNSYQGSPGAQFELRQKRQNLCRNVPEMC